MARTSSKNTQKSAPKGKFNGMIHRTSDEVLKGRGDRIIKSAQLSQEAIVRGLEQKLINLEDQRDRMLDLSPDNRMSLKIDNDFNADTWTANYQKLSIDIVNTKVELEIAQKNMEELFG